jgi:hypothetical protein
MKCVKSFVIVLWCVELLLVYGMNINVIMEYKF